MAMQRFLESLASQSKRRREKKKLIILHALILWRKQQMSEFGDSKKQNLEAVLQSEKNKTANPEDVIRLLNLQSQMREEFDQLAAESEKKLSECNGTLKSIEEQIMHKYETEIKPMEDELEVTKLQLKMSDDAVKIYSDLCESTNTGECEKNIKKWKAAASSNAEIIRLQAELEELRKKYNEMVDKYNHALKSTSPSEHAHKLRLMRGMITHLLHELVELKVGLRERAKIGHYW
jgi:hypothetical protein